MGHFETRTTTEAGRAVVALAGECDLAVRDELAAALQAAVRDAHVVVVDLAELRFLDSSGVHGLITAHHAARDKGGHLYVVNSGGSVATVLDITGIGALLSPAGDDPARG
jgi:anti-sigma B factor antagonist